MTAMPTSPWSDLEIQTRMRQAIIKHEDAVLEMREYGKMFAAARRAYEVKKNTSILVAKQNPDLKTDAQRLAWATLEAADLRFEKDCAESEYEAQKSVCYGLKSEQDTLRSLLRSARDLQDEPGWGYGNR